MKAIPDLESQDNTNFRTSIPAFSSVSARGEAYMRVVFGDGDLDTFLSTMEEYWPDLKALIVNDVYGMYQAEISVLGKVETSQINIASLVPMDCPSEVGWHMRGLINNGGSMEELKEAFEIAKRVFEVCQVVLKKDLPRVEDVVGKERLISRDG
jgi:alkylhydroperoxidase/carboxymuconolactone decarboxylase family protein YurZ